MSAIPSEEAIPSRVIARLTGSAAGPTLICVAGIHGNEPAGVTALQRVAGQLQAAGGPARGEFVGLVGNLTALARGERFLHRDLNRNWHSLHGPYKQRGRIVSSEDDEQQELAEEIRRAIEDARGKVYLLDLHTTSGSGRPFSVIADSPRNRRFALTFPNPLVLGLEEHLDGTLVDCMTNAGHSAVAFEGGGGRTDDPSSVAHLEAAVRVALESTRLAEFPADGHSAARDTLRQAAKDLPQIVEIRYHHAISPGDGFAMKEGWRGFDRIEHGQELATDWNGGVVAPEAGYLLMPLYQKQGLEGFFVVREVRRVWLRLSALLRTLRADRVVHWLPGIRRDPNDEDILMVNPVTARFFPIEILHLLGFKRDRSSEALRMRRRY